MKFFIFVVLLVIVVGAYCQSKRGAKEDTAGAKGTADIDGGEETKDAGDTTVGTPRILTPQEIIRIASTLSKIVGPEHAKELTRMAVTKLATNSKTGAGARSRANSSARSLAGSDATSRAGSDCKCMYRPVFTIL